MRGHLREFETMMALSTEKESTGSPEMFHARILTGSPRVALTEDVGEQGIFFFWQMVCHSWMASCRKSTVNAPR